MKSINVRIVVQSAIVINYNIFIIIFMTE